MLTRRGIFGLFAAFAAAPLFRRCKHEWKRDQAAYQWKCSKCLEARDPDFKEFAIATGADSEFAGLMDERVNYSARSRIMARSRQRTEAGYVNFGQHRPLVLHSDGRLVEWPDALKAEDIIRGRRHAIMVREPFA